MLVALTNSRQLIFTFALFFSAAPLAARIYPRLSLKLMLLETGISREPSLSPQLHALLSLTRMPRPWSIMRRGARCHRNIVYPLVCRFDTICVACATHSKRMIRHRNLLTRSRVCNSPLQANLTRYNM